MSLEEETEDAVYCPICTDEMDVTDRHFRPCKCGYQVCSFCWHRIKEKLDGKCPNCRLPYDDSNIEFSAPDPEEIEREKSSTKKKKGTSKAAKATTTTATTQQAPEEESEISLQDTTQQQHKTAQTCVWMNSSF